MCPARLSMRDHREVGLMGEWEGAFSDTKYFRKRICILRFRPGKSLWANALKPVSEVKVGFQTLEGWRTQHRRVLLQPFMSISAARSLECVQEAWRADHLLQRGPQRISQLERFLVVQGLPSVLIACREAGCGGAARGRPLLRSCWFVWAFNRLKVGL